MKYYIYHIPSKNYVGCTRSVFSQSKFHGVRMDQIDVLHVTEDIEEASELEQFQQRRLLGKADGDLYVDRHPPEFILDLPA